MPKVIVFVIVLLSFVNPVYVPFLEMAAIIKKGMSPIRHLPCAESDTHLLARHYDDRQ